MKDRHIDQSMEQNEKKGKSQTEKIFANHISEKDLYSEYANNS